jgi:hypothetical protein
MVATPPDASATNNSTIKSEQRLEDTSESSGDEDRPTPAKKIKLDESKGFFLLYI